MAIGLCGMKADDDMKPISKRRLSLDSNDETGRESGNPQPQTKRLRVAESAESASASADPSTRRPPCDAIFRLSDELLVRVFSYFNERELVDMATTSRRFYSLTSDSQLWRPLYYRRFVLPRAHLIPGFRTATSGRKSYKLHFGEGKELWADGGFGRSGGVVSHGPPDAASSKLAHTVDWKKSYKQWHNWERGRCSVDELPLHDIPFRRTFAKFVNGHAVTVDVISGLRVWDLRTRTLLSQAEIRMGESADAEPTCVTVDGQGLGMGVLGIAVGMDDGTFGVWKLNLEERTMKLVCRHTVKRVGSLVALAYLHPFVVTATSAHLVVVYTLDHPISEASIQDTLAGAIDIDPSRIPTEPGPTGTDPAQQTRNEHLIVPYLLLTFNGRNTMPPRALSIRKTASSVVASIAYTFNTYGGWCIGVQDFDIKPDVLPKPQVIMSRTASTPPKQSPQSRYSYEGSALRTWWPRSDNAAELDSDGDDEDGYDSPVSLCYSHPYLLATMPDNTMMLHLCTSTATSMSISAGTRLYGHTSAISDAAITPWGKAVSVSSQGNDIRLWKLEGGFDNSSVALQPTSSQLDRDIEEAAITSAAGGMSARPRDTVNLDDRRNWVGFDDERVVVLKESRTGKESFMVYDFT